MGQLDDHQLSLARESGQTRAHFVPCPPPPLLLPSSLSSVPNVALSSLLLQLSNVSWTGWSARPPPVELVSLTSSGVWTRIVLQKLFPLLTGCNHNHMSLASLPTPAVPKGLSLSCVPGLSGVLSWITWPHLHLHTHCPALPYVMAPTALTHCRLRVAIGTTDQTIGQHEPAGPSIPTTCVDTTFHIYSWLSWALFM